MPDIRLENVTKIYKSQTERRRRETAVQDASLTVEQGEFVFVIGSSGSGKSTLLGLMSGLVRPTRGTVRLGDKDLSMLKLVSKNKVSMCFGYVPQEMSLMRKRTVAENLELAVRVRGFGDKHTREARIKKVLGLVGLPGAEKKYPVELSTGEGRRVELARAIINSPPILVLDELTANLDDDSIWDIFHLLNDINNRGTTVIMATHASRYVNIMRRRVLTMVDGRIHADVRGGKYGDVAGPGRGPSKPI
ncbi:MAG: ATP-binding cassette domain-containing protein [Clostridia bacterium]|nr:ATP-binding cassette domain-containing protein [Clostridia bacterium]MBQ3076504.1 ATP-binding cassette domain-containing protein [Clostridia bacterium]